jgi:hypothetical protein
VLCTLCILLWVLTCCKELSDLLLVSYALFTPQFNDQKMQLASDDAENSQNSKTSLKVPGKSSSVKLMKVSLATGQKMEASGIDAGFIGMEKLHIQMSGLRCAIVMLLSVIPQVALVAVLGLAGVKFLASTIQLSELLLNAIALELVLNVDTIIFKNLAPDAAVALINRAAPLRSPRPRGVHAMFHGWSKFIFVGVIMTAVYYVFLEPLVTNMREVDRLMCSGPNNFVAVPLSWGPTVVGAPTKADIDRDSSLYRSVMQRAELHSQPVKQFYEGAPYIFNSVNTMKGWKERTIEDWGMNSVGPTFMFCADLAQGFAHPHIKDPTWEAMKLTFGDADLTHCDNMTKYCNERQWPQARLLCPKTCGGHSPLSGQISDDAKNGMPFACILDKTVESMSTVSCNERTPAELASDEGFQNYFEGIASWLMPAYAALCAGNATCIGGRKQEVIDYSKTAGCNFFKPWFLNTSRHYQLDFRPTGGPLVVYDFCLVTETLDFRSARALCPITCGCSTTLKTYYDKMALVFDYDAAVTTQCPGKCFDMPAFGRPACNTTTSSKNQAYQLKARERRNHPTHAPPGNSS